MDPRPPPSPREAGARHVAREDRRVDRRFQLQVTALAGLCSLVVAAVVVSATVWVATTQTHAQARQEQRTFIRTQRQAAYARLFQVDRLLSTDEAGLESTCTLTPAKQAEVQQQLDEIDVAAKNIAMIGSTAAWDAADKLNKAHHSLIGLWQSYCNAVSPSPTGTRQPPPPKPQLMGIRAADKDLEVASQQFLTLARSEIQS